MMNKTYKKLIAASLASILALSVAGFSYQSVEAKTTEAASQEEAVLKTEDDDLNDIIKGMVKTESMITDKDETVYVFSDNSGRVKSVTVSEWLKNKDGAAVLTDASDLQAIENVKGDETFTKDGHKITWQANGGDIYYQGTTDKKVPVTQKVTYYLDGKEMTADEIAGKSGEVKITIAYDNEAKDGDVYVPFTVVSALAFSANQVSNLEVDHGEVLSEGKNTVAVGLRFPGLEASLRGDDKGDRHDLDIPSSVTYTLKTDKFEMPLAMAVVKPNLLTKALSDDVGNTFDKVGDKVSQIDEAGRQLTDGTGQLKSGLQTVNDAVPTLADGTQALTDGVRDYTDGVAQAADGAAQLNSGLKDLKVGSSQMKAGFEDSVNADGSVNAGAVNGSADLAQNLAALDEQLRNFNLPGVSLTEEQKQSIGQAAATDAAVVGAGQNMSAGVDQLVNGLAGAVSGVDQGMIDGASAQVAAGVVAQSAEARQVIQVLTEAGYSEEQATAVLTGIAQATASTTTSAVLQATADTISQSNPGAALKEALTGGVSQVAAQAAVGGAEGVASEVNATLAGYAPLIGQIKSGVSRLSQGASSLAGGIGQLYGGAAQIDSYLGEAGSGASVLAAGMTELNRHSDELKDGAVKLSDGAQTLSDGLAKLLEGAVELDDGMIKFNDEAISELTSFYYNDLTDFNDTITALKAAGDDYRSFGGCEENMAAQTTFIIKLDGITAK